MSSPPIPASLTAEQRRALIALWCRIAWANGVLRSVELDVIISLFHRVSLGALSAEELEQWIFEPPAEPSEPLPGELRRLFVHEALAIASADGQVEDTELSAIRAALEHCFPEARAATAPTESR